MLRKPMIAAFSALLISLSVHAQSSAASTKSYELYSWKIKGHWYYSLLPDTNRAKSYDEITAGSVVKRDAAALKAELRKLAKGAQVSWMSDAPAGAGKSTTGQALNVKHPSRQRIKGIKAYCDRLGIRLRLT